MYACACVCVYNGIFELSEITFVLPRVAQPDPSGLLPVSRCQLHCLLRTNMQRKNIKDELHMVCAQLRTYSKRHAQQKVQEPKCIFHVGAKTCSGWGQGAQDCRCANVWMHGCLSTRTEPTLSTHIDQI